MQNADELKRKLRKLKRLEMKLRFGHVEAAERMRARLVWDAYFGQKARYPIDLLVVMDRESLKMVIELYLSEVYFRAYGVPMGGTSQPERSLLDELGVSPDADRETIRKRYRELARKVHPDVGGNSEDFIRLKDAVDALLR